MPESLPTGEVSRRESHLRKASLGNESDLRLSPAAATPPTPRKLESERSTKKTFSEFLHSHSHRDKATTAEPLRLAKESISPTPKKVSDRMSCSTALTPPCRARRIWQA